MTTAAPPLADKREAILAAALRLIARLGLHAAPMSALAREAGVAAGTLYLYFPSKEAMINALYLEVLADRNRAIPDEEVHREAAGAETPADRRRLLWRVWHALARWYLDHPEASSLLHQCQASGILTQETRDAEQRSGASGLARFEAAVARGALRPLSRQLFWALFAGPIFVLAQMRDAGEIAIDDSLLRQTFDGVWRSVLPSDEVAPGRTRRR